MCIVGSIQFSVAFHESCINFKHPALQMFNNSLMPECQIPQWPRHNFPFYITLSPHSR